MQRRDWMRLIALSATGPLSWAAEAGKSIQLHVDLDVDPAHEKELIANFHTIFEPTIGSQPGFVGVKLLKLRSAVSGEMPSNTNFRLIISFQTEKQRQAWTATADHRRAWPAIAKTLRTKPGALLYDEV
jgi:heme-degrading monooxygenase HmoA